MLLFVSHGKTLSQLCHIQVFCIVIFSVSWPLNSHCFGEHYIMLLLGSDHKHAWESHLANRNIIYCFMDISVCWIEILWLIKLSLDGNCWLNISALSSRIEEISWCDNKQVSRFQRLLTYWQWLIIKRLCKRKSFRKFSSFKVHELSFSFLFIVIWEWNFTVMKKKQTLRL